MTTDGASGANARASTPTGGGRRGRVIAVAAGVAAVAVAGVVTWAVLAPGANGTGGAPGTTPVATSEAPGTLPPLSGPEGHGDAPVVTPTAIGDVFPVSIAGFTAGDIRENPAALDAGAIAASSTTYTQGTQTLELDAAQWPDESAATARAEAAFAEAGFSADEALRTGTVGQPPIGRYWYFERDGVAHLYFSEGPNDVHLQGAPYWVQEFFVQFPKPRQ